MGIDKGLTRVPGASDVAVALQQIQRDFEEKGISADMDIDMVADSGGAAGMRPVVKNIRLRLENGLQGRAILPPKPQLIA